MMVISIIYEEQTNMIKQSSQNSTISNENKEQETVNKEEKPVENEKEQEKPVENNDDQYVGEEENNAEQPAQSTDDKVIQLVKKEWGKDDSVTFNIVDKNGTKYRVSVTSQSTEVLKWYEVDIETWEVSEF